MRIKKQCNKINNNYLSKSVYATFGKKKMVARPDNALSLK